MTQIVNLLNLATDIQEEILFLPLVTSGREDSDEIESETEIDYAHKKGRSSHGSVRPIVFPTRLVGCFFRPRASSTTERIDWFANPYWATSINYHLQSTDRRESDTR